MENKTFQFKRGATYFYRFLTALINQTTAFNKGISIGCFPSLIQVLCCIAVKALTLEEGLLLVDLP